MDGDLRNFSDDADCKNFELTHGFVAMGGPKCRLVSSSLISNFFYFQSIASRKGSRNSKISVPKHR